MVEGAGTAYPHRVVATSRITMNPTTVQMVVANELAKGDVLGVARFAGIQAARHAPALLPAATTDPLGPVTVEFEISDGAIDVRATVACSAEAQATPHALAAATVAALTIFDMCKAVDRAMVIEDVSLAT